MKIFAFVIFGVCSTLQILYAQTTRKDNKGNLEIIGKNGKLLEYHLLDFKGNYRSSSNLAKIIYTYDTLDYLIQETFYNSKGKRWQYPSGISMKKYIWNELRDVMVINNYDSSENRTIDKKIGASIICYKYDSLRKVKAILYFDKDSLRTNNNEGYSRIEYFSQLDRKKFYDSNDILIKETDKKIEYLMGLQLSSASIPKWLRKARQSNKVDGVNFKSLNYELTLFGQGTKGKIQFYVVIENGDIKDIRLQESKNVTEKMTNRTKDALKNAHFISLSTNESRSVEGLIKLYFETSDDI